MIILGRGLAGPSNLRLAGREQSIASLNQAVDEALGEANAAGQAVDYAVLALAGSTSPDVRREVTNWAKMRKLSSRMGVIHDVDPVLVGGTENGWGIALVVGTGTVAIGVDTAGNSATKGGWGHWFGDKGSGFDIACKALAAVAEAADDIGPETILSDLVMDKLGTANPRSILKEVSADGDTRRQVAALAPLILNAAGQHDKVALEIVNDAVEETVKLVAAVAKTLEFTTPYPLALGGGVACKSKLFRDELVARLNRLQPPPGKVTVVDEPVLGCLEIARAKMRGVVA
jgi:N-acetylglucosamine kinase-like BadF-type ATPase